MPLEFGVLELVSGDEMSGVEADAVLVINVEDVAVEVPMYELDLRGAILTLP